MGGGPSFCVLDKLSVDADASNSTIMEDHRKRIKTRAEVPYYSGSPTGTWGWEVVKCMNLTSAMVGGK